MRSSSRIFFLTSAILLLILFSACGGSSSHTVTPTTPPAIAVTMSAPSSQTLAAGGTLGLNASVANDSSGAGLTWSLSCSQTTCGSLSASTGTSVTYTAPATVTANLAVTITATSKADSSKLASVVITINPATVISVSINPASAQTLTAGDTLDFTATVTNDTANKGVTWSVSCAVSSCGTVSSASANPVTYTAPSSVAANLAVTLTATSVSDTSKTATVAITVTPQPVISVAISPSTAQSVVAGGSLDFTATLANDSANKGVTWAATCSAQDCGTLSGTTASATKYTAPATVAANLAVSLVATSVADASKHASVAITVTPPNPNAVLKGKYAFVFNGYSDPAGTTPVARDAMLGSFAADGNGNITSGMVIVNSIYGVAQGTVTGTYAVGADQRGTLSITVNTDQVNTLRHLVAKRSLTADPTKVGPFTFAFALGSMKSKVATKGAFIETDDTAGDAQRGTGTLFLQTPSAFVKNTIDGGFAYLMIGESAAQAYLASAGVFTADGNSNITGGAGDMLSSVDGVTNNHTLSGTYGNPDSTTGIFNLRLTAAGAASTAPSHFYAAVVNTEQLLLMSAEAHTTADIYAGFAHHQKLATFGDSSLNGNFVAWEMDAESQDTTTGMTRRRMDAGGAPSSTVFEDVLLHGSFDGAANMVVDASDEDQGGSYSAGVEKGSYGLNIGTNGRVVMATSGGPGLAFYLYDTNQGYLVDWSSGKDVGYGEFAAQDPALDSSAEYIAGTYVMRGEWSLDATHYDFSGVVKISSDGTMSGTDDYAYQGPVGSLTMGGTVMQFDANGRFILNDTTNNSQMNCYIVTSKKLECANPSAAQPTIIHFEQ